MNSDSRFDARGTGDSKTTAVGRRTVLAGALGGSLSLLAGCLGDGDAVATEDGDDDGSGEGGDDGDAGEDDGSGEGGDGGSADGPDFEEPESYVMEQRFPEETSGDTGPMIYEVHGDDLLFYEEGERDESPSYIVDGDLYSMLGGQCTKMSDYDSEDEGGPEYPVAESLVFEYVESDTLDGVAVDVYRLGGAQESRYYVDPERNYLLRIDGGEGAPVTDFHSFNEVDPIEPPDAECTDLGGQEDDSSALEDL